MSVDAGEILYPSWDRRAIPCAGYAAVAARAGVPDEARVPAGAAETAHYLAAAEFWPRGAVPLLAAGQQSQVTAETWPATVGRCGMGWLVEGFTCGGRVAGGAARRVARTGGGFIGPRPPKAAAGAGATLGCGITDALANCCGATRTN